jgi:hypothetical protein
MSRESALNGKQKILIGISKTVTGRVPLIRLETV